MRLTEGELKKLIEQEVEGWKDLLPEESKTVDKEYVAERITDAVNPIGYAVEDLEASELDEETSAKLTELRAIEEKLFELQSWFSGEVNLKEDEEEIPAATTDNPATP